MSYEATQHIQQMTVETDSPVKILLRFLNVIRYRKHYLIISLFLCVAIGILKYWLAVRIYESEAEVLILNVGGGSVLSNSTSTLNLAKMMPTLEKLFSSDIVLKATLESLPEEYTTRFAGLTELKQLRSLAGNLRVFSVRNSDVIGLSYRDPSPENASAVLRHLLAAYFDFLDKTHRGTTEELLALLRSEKNRLETVLTTKEHELINLKAHIGEFYENGEDSTNVLVERIVEMNRVLVEAQKQTLEAKSFLISVHNAVKQGTDIQEYVLRALESLGQELMSRQMGFQREDAWLNMRANYQLVEDRGALEQALTQYGSQHSIVLQLQNRIKLTEDWLHERAELNQQTYQQIEEHDLAPQLLSVAQQQYEYAVAQERFLAFQYESEKKAGMELNDHMASAGILELELERMHKYFDLLVERIKDLELSQSASIESKIVSPPSIPKLPVSPKLLVNLLLSLFCGTALGTGIIYIVDQLDDRFHSPEEMRDQLDLPILTMIRTIDPIEGEGIETVQSYAAPGSVQTEAFRALRTSLMFSGESLRTIVVTSTEPGDGKTTTTSNMAVVFAQSENRILLIDADIRRHGLTSLLDMRGSQGLTQILLSTSPVHETVKENLLVSAQENLHVIPAGPRPVNPSELLASEQFTNLIAWAESQYDFILIDAPPILAVSDPAIVAKASDGLVLVVRPDKNKRKFAIRAVETLREFGINILGLVANGLSDKDGKMKEFNYGYGYGYYYEEGKKRDDDDDNQQETPDAA